MATIDILSTTRLNISCILNS